MDKSDYKDYDDLGLYDSVIKKVTLDHEHKSIVIEVLKVVGRVDRNQGFTYAVKNGKLIFDGVINANIKYLMEWGEWSEFYRSVVLVSSKILERAKQLPINNERKEKLKHIYLGIDNGNEYNEIDIVCTAHSLILDDAEFILHDHFKWLYEENID